MHDGGATPHARVFQEGTDLLQTGHPSACMMIPCASQRLRSLSEKVEWIAAPFGLMSCGPNADTSIRKRIRHGINQSSFGS